MAPVIGKDYRRAPKGAIKLTTRTREILAIMRNWERMEGMGQ